MDDSCLESGIVPDETQEIPYPEGAIEVDDENDDADSHSKEDSSIYSKTRVVSRRPREDFDLSTTYPLANSHENAYKDSSSHTRYSELYSELAVKNYLDANREEVTNYSVANSHGDHSVSSENRERSFRENAESDQLDWDIRQQTNYEVANSHSNYRVFYDSQTQPRELLQTVCWPIESWREHLGANNGLLEDQKQKSASIGQMCDDESIKTSRSGAKSDPSSEPACDIEQCLVQIEESLLNIEQNLLHVQDLDIPELRNLLYKSPSIEKSLYEVQDLLYADGIVPVINKRKSLGSEDEDDDEEEDEEEEEEEEEEVWVGHSITMKDDNEDDDAGAGAFDASNEESSDTANIEENNQSGSVDDRSNTDCIDGSTIFREETADPNCNHEKAMNFIPNSLNKTLPRRIVLEGAKENIRLCSSEPEEPITIDYNLNTTCAEKKLFCRDKCHSRTNSLDENSTFSNLDSTDKRDTGKSSLQNLLFESTNGNFPDLTGKARSEEMLQTPQNKSITTNKKRLNEKRWTIMDAKTEDFRRKLESISSNRCFTMSNVNEQKRAKISKEITVNTPRPREKSPNRTKRSSVSVEKIQEKEKESGGGKSSDKRKRKKISSRSQSSSENALVPSKLISLSLSLLLAALLQAVRCLTDLVEDAFRSVSYDRSGLLQ